MAYLFYNSHFNCFICSKPSEMACDHCGRFICDRHLREKRLNNSYPDNIFCKPCFNAGNFDIRMHRIGAHDSVINMPAPH